MSQLESVDVIAISAHQSGDACLLSGSGCTQFLITSDHSSISSSCKDFCLGSTTCLKDFPHLTYSAAQSARSSLFPASGILPQNVLVTKTLGAVRPVIIWWFYVQSSNKKFFESLNFVTQLNSSTLETNEWSSNCNHLQKSYDLFHLSISTVLKPQLVVNHAHAQTKDKTR